MRVTINSDTTFFLCDDLGDVPDGSECGLYHEDTRFLSSYALTLDGLAPLLLAGRAATPYAAVHFLTNPMLPRVPRGRLSVIRRRQVTEGMHERIEITNLQEHTFYASIYVKRDGQSIEIDSRPSDAIALGVATSVPIFVAEHVLDEVA